MLLLCRLLRMTQAVEVRPSLAITPSISLCSDSLHRDLFQLSLTQSPVRTCACLHCIGLVYSTNMHIHASMTHRNASLCFNCMVAASALSLVHVWLVAELQQPVWLFDMVLLTSCKCGDCQSYMKTGFALFLFMCISHTSP